MEPLQTAPSYHRPIPWQVLAALALICGSILTLALQAALLLNLHDTLPEPGPKLVLGILVGTALAALASVVLAVGIAARQNWARVLEIALCVLCCFYNVPAAVGVGIGPVRDGLGFDGRAVLPVYLALALCLALLFLLHNEKAAAYTYRGGGARYPEE